MKVLTAAQMRDVDRRTVELGIPGLVLMENAGHRVVEFLEARFAPLSAQRIAVLCGKGNNGGDGLVIARQLFTRFQPRALHVVLLADPEDPESIASALEDACGSEATLLRKLGLERAQDFTWAMTAEGTLEVYRQVHARRKERS